MFSLRLVPMLCCLLVPLQGMAQAESPDKPILGPVTPPPLLPAPGAPAPEEPPQAESPDEPQGELIPPEERSRRDEEATAASRVPVGILLGTIGGAIGALPGVLIGGEALCIESCTEDQSGVYIGFVLALGGLFGGSAFTITQVGHWLDGQGRFWPTVGGVVLGSLAGILVGAAGFATVGAAGAIPMILGPAVGGVIAYELSDSSSRSAAAEALGPEPRIIVPMMRVSPGGGLIGGLAGTF
ncbi:MAG TPA: hypothetical protein VF815_06010 [Myxococcaceae bacterium]|jgi:hypothetical protein